MVETSTRRDVLLGLLLVNSEDIIGEVNVGGSLGCSDHSLVELSILRDIGQVKSKIKTLNHRKNKTRQNKNKHVMATQGTSAWNSLKNCPHK